MCDANPDPDPWVRIPQKIHQNRKMQMIPDPDVVRIRESYQTKGECLRIRILESGFGIFMRTPDSTPPVLIGLSSHVFVRVLGI